ncbi:tyrosyl-tRNA synthetase [Loa loa]|uniref:Tyrosine--tRNA ligase n=1 Tax=Loa loa TaxID=7209 RepID=A0A1I7W0T6_LOALO|nr:tyrosyl-tRNA synthetase [Loa loa]EFO24253.2 tyrosyl-tRNA synthetase [Loa loa]
MSCCEKKSCLILSRFDCDYTPMYCEENIWKLCKKVSVSLEELNCCSAVFISNKNGMVPLWKQRAAAAGGRDYVIWDYHVILLYSKSGSVLVYDFDTTLTFPCDAQTYWIETFRPELNLDANYHRCFRVISGLHYLEHFSSDRSHMLETSGNHKAPPPSWPPIYNPDIGNNLRNFISMDFHLLKDISKVYDENSFCKLINERLRRNKLVAMRLPNLNFEVATSFCYSFHIRRFELKRAFTTSSPAKNIKQFCVDLTKRNLISTSHPSNLSSDDFKVVSTLPDVVYAGFDPTAESLHIGHLLVITNLFRATLHGCHAIALIGGATAYVGDPSGHVTDRIIVSGNEIDQYAGKINLQLMKLFNNFKEGNVQPNKHLSIVNNADWHLKMSSIQFLEVCRDFRLGDMLRLGMVKSRMRDGSGLSCSEFLYQIFQSYDWYRLSRDYNCHFQIGGNDQLGHFDAGYDYIKKKTGKLSASICLPLLTDAQGKKLSKTSKEGSNIWLDERKTSPFTFYQYFRQKPDSDIVPLLRYFSLRNVEEIEEIEREHHANLGKWVAQEKLAEELTKFVHGSNGLKMAKQCSKILFHGSLSELRKMPTSLIEEQFGSASVQQLFRSGFSTMGELADRVHNGEGSSINKMKAGALKLNGTRFTDPDELVDFDKICLDGKNITLVCWGKRKYHLVRWID